MIIRTFNFKTGKDVDVFKPTARSAILVARCPHCNEIHILLFKDKDDKIASACLDITNAQASVLIGELVRLLAEDAANQVRQPGETLN